MTTLVREVRKYVELHRDRRNGIAWVEDGTSGCGHSCHANIDESGSVEGMRNLYPSWHKGRILKSHGFYYNIDSLVVTSELDQLAADECRCQACIERRTRGDA